MCRSWLRIVCIKSMEPLSFDGPAETDFVRRFPTSTKVFEFASPGLEPETYRTGTARLAFTPP